MDLGITNTGGTNMILFFNVTSPVGPNQVNASEDVMLVQYLMMRLGKSGVPADEPDLRDKMASLIPTGKFDDFTGECIRGFQARFGTMFVDGIVSRAKNVSITGGKYAIWMMNFLVRDQFRTWPRLQDAPDCPAQLKSMFTTIL